MSDVVYLVRGGRNEELRYSLRSLYHLPHDRVWVVGANPPPWLTGVERIGVRQQQYKFADVPLKLLAACRHPEISDPFWLFNDDFFVTRPVDGFPLLHRGPLRAQMACGWGESYRQGADRTARLLVSWGHRDDGLLSYELHMPLWVRKREFVEAWQRAQFVDFTIPTCFRSLYGNHAQLGGREVDDAKVRDCDSLPDPDAPAVSTTDRTFARGEVGRWIRARLPDPSPYERNRRSS